MSQAKSNGLVKVKFLKGMSGEGVSFLPNEVCHIPAHQAVPWADAGIVVLVAREAPVQTNMKGGAKEKAVTR